jgi:hypothetical protein
VERFSFSDNEVIVGNSHFASYIFQLPLFCYMNIFTS